MTDASVWPEAGGSAESGGGARDPSAGSTQSLLLKEEKKEKKKKKRKMFDEEVDRYETYEEYLDSLVSEEDHLYLEDEEMARVIAELGYRSVMVECAQ